MRRLFNNLRFRSKIIWIFGIMFFFSMAISGISYYQYTSRDIEENFRIGAVDVLGQVVDTLELRLGVIRQRSQAMLTNYTFAVGMSDYLNAPSDSKKVKVMGEVSSFLKDLETGENLIHSTYIYTDRWEFDNFVRLRNWDFQFKEEPFYQAFEEHPGISMRWFPVEKDQIFKDGDEVIPYVRKFSVLDYDGDLYLVIQLKKKALDELLSGKYAFFDEMLIVDDDGNTIVGSGKLDTVELMTLMGEPGDARPVVISDYQSGGDSYTVVCERLEENGWSVFGLKSRETLLGNLKNLRLMILNMTGVVFLIGVAAILLLSHQMTSALSRLEKRMSCVQKGDFDARFFYPYKDEVGSLARSFNYMVGEIQRLVKKQEETIEELKQERDYVGEVQKQKRKAELRALQAQINPHFLYNTLNAITWQAADQGAEEISILSNALGKFFRVSLSKGAEILTLREELEHVGSYLDIQSIRYHDKLNYRIEVGDEWMEYRVIKLILQPLAENSIYHGIKEKRGPGQIRIWAEPSMEGEKPCLKLVVWDNGAGIPADKLELMNRALAAGETERAEGYGIYNVNERLRLFYGEEYGLFYESEEGQWTKATLKLPLDKGEVDACIG